MRVARELANWSSITCDEGGPESFTYDLATVEAVVILFKVR